LPQLVIRKAMICDQHGLRAKIAGNRLPDSRLPSRFDRKKRSRDPAFLERALATGFQYRRCGSKRGCKMTCLRPA